MRVGTLGDGTAAAFSTVGGVEIRWTATPPATAPSRKTETTNDLVTCASVVESEASNWQPACAACQAKLPRAGRRTSENIEKFPTRSLPATIANATVDRSNRQPTSGRQPTRPA